MNSWFVVDKDGLKELQAGKPKHYIIRELVQNALDEDITECSVNISYEGKVTTIRISDNSPNGFKDLRDGYTLFRHTDKRFNAEKRGRFNLGEKQSIAICEYARIETTKGTIVFDKDGRQELDLKTDKGTIVIVEVITSQKEFEEMLTIIRDYLIPKGIKFEVNGELIGYKKPYKTFESELLTEVQQDNILRKVMRKTKVNVIKSDSTWLYEMGIPVQRIECQFSLDVQQKIPMGVDRETVSVSFLQDLYAEVLNNVHDDVTSDDSSELWVRTALSDDRIDRGVVQEMITKRYGDKVCVANTFDRNSIDEAISNGYNVIYGSELSKEEWANIKGSDAMDSSSDLFGTNFANAERVEPDDKQKAVGEFARKIAKRLLHIDLTVRFVKGGQNMVVAQYGGNVLTFNVSKLYGFFDETVCVKTIDLILHELGHHAGNHTESAYHELITKMSGELIMIALNEPDFFR